MLVITRGYMFFKYMSWTVLKTFTIQGAVKWGHSQDSQDSPAPLAAGIGTTSSLRFGSVTSSAISVVDRQETAAKDTLW